LYDAFINSAKIHLIPEPNDYFIFLQLLCIDFDLFGRKYAYFDLTPISFPAFSSFFPTFKAAAAATPEEILTCFPIEVSRAGKRQSIKPTYTSSSLVLEFRCHKV